MGERPFQRAERCGSPPGRPAAQAARWLEQPAGPGRPLGGRQAARRGQPPPGYPVAPGLQQVAEWEAVLPYLDLGEARVGQQGLHSIRVIAPEVADELVGRAEPALVRWNRQQQPAAGAEPFCPLLQRRRVVFDVLEHLEGADQVELAVAEIAHRDVADLSSSGRAGPLVSHRPGRSVRLDADVPVALRQPDAKSTLTAADF